MLGNFSTPTDPMVFNCSKSRHANYIYIGMQSVKTILLLPLCIYIFYLGYQKWHRQCSFQVMSHSDLFTYHLAVMELFWVPGIICYLCGTYTDCKVLLIPGTYSLAVSYFGESFFHLLTCVERYLAVVHPITYVGLRNARGIRIRNISIGIVWMLCFGLSGFTANLSTVYVVILMLTILFFLMLVITFCSISVLFVLVRPVPGDNSRGNKQIDQSKLRAFQTITAISCALWLWGAASLFFFAVFVSSLQTESVVCLLRVSIYWFNLPCSLVLPLLYLNKEGKLWRGRSDCD